MPLGYQPDLGSTAVHFVGGVALFRRKRGERLPQLDQLAVAVRPVVEKREGFGDFCEGLGVRHAA
jgi:hypothetical protein